MKKNEGFSSIWGFILVAIGLALGIGSLWRFPYVVGANGGAIFILLYVAIIIIIGIPLMTCEVAIGFHAQHTAIDAYKTIAPKSKFYLAGYVHLFAAILILGYTAPIYSWIFKYLVVGFEGSLMGLDNAGVVAFFDAFNGNKSQVFLFFMFNLALNIGVLIFGVQKGVERISKVLLPLLFIIMAAVIISVLRLDGAMEGVKFLFLPDPAKFSFNGLLTCLGQAFFALGLGMLGSMVFGSYIKDPDENIFKSSSMICISLIVAGVLAGLMVLPMVFATDLEVAEGVTLSFLTLPNAFNVVPGGGFLAILFYLGFYIAAFTSSVGVYEAIVGLLMEKFNLNRMPAILISAVPIVAIAYFSIHNDALFSFLDVLESNYVLVVSCLAICIFSGYVWGIDNVIDASNIKSPGVKAWMRVSIKYITPLAIVLIFLTQFIA
ncbi:sodium-dependent transporter [Peptoniphilus equinus]|uniref:Transporter n=1 Tax=Peptoniphilus equinus TaxID=3016343 RepID=A0ABY7QTV1_9FIRM|nr:sodium-dependent transporter [Peptoniphilus equinus]WBW49710.1 sodium-dependent transporter [Peptoniphilus equinus]